MQPQEPPMWIRMCTAHLYILLIKLGEGYFFELGENPVFSAKIRIFSAKIRYFGFNPSIFGKNPNIFGENLVFSAKIGVFSAKSRGIVRGIIGTIVSPEVGLEYPGFDESRYF